VDMKPCEDPEHIDYLAFSAHKMYAPFGSGVLIGPKSVFNKFTPFIQGGGAVKLVSPEFVIWENSPYNNEAGTPNMVGIIALLAAIRTLERLNMEAIETYETGLLEYTETALLQIPDIRVYGISGKSAEKIGILSFELKDLHHSLLTKMLSCEAGIAVRSGLFCAHPYVEKLLGLTEQEICYYRKNPDVPFPGLLRISFGLYNTCHEVDIFLDCLSWIAKNKKQCQGKYEEILKREPAQNSCLLSQPWKKMP
jgi:Selenocysteine lyase